MTIDYFFVMIVCYFIVIAFMVYSVLSAKELDIRNIEPVEIKPEKKDINSIVAASKSEFLKPLPKPISKQVPKEDVDGLFIENNPFENDLEQEYTQKDTQEQIPPEQDEVITTEIDSWENEFVEQIEPTRVLCMDYMQMEQSITNMVRGTVSIQDKDLIEQLEGTEIFTQIELAMTTTNLALVRKILEKI